MMRSHNGVYARLSRWNPFRQLDTSGDARNAARAGIYPALFLALIQAAGVAGWFSLGNTDGVGLALDSGVIGLIGLLGWRIWFRQGRWSSIAVAALFGLKVTTDLAVVVAGEQPPTSAFLLLMLSGATIASIRGSWRLHDLNRRPQADLRVFD